MENLFARGEKTGQVIKDVTTVYLPDSGMKHEPGILKGTCKTHLFATATGVLMQIMASTNDNNKKINFSSH